jgi:hypothetical protein
MRSRVAKKKHFAMNANALPRRIFITEQDSSSPAAISVVVGIPIPERCFAD